MLGFILPDDGKRKTSASEETTPHPSTVPASETRLHLSMTGY